jgi:hypothetical protein
MGSKNEADPIIGHTNLMSRYFILFYWIGFWLLNVIDKVIGGAHFLFVGKDRFAQMERYFDSIGLTQPFYANTALILTFALELMALLYFCGSLYQLYKKNLTDSRSWFILGILFTMITFTFFSIGDQIFGDHFELLEHGIFWLISLLSWFIFIQLDRLKIPESFKLDKQQNLLALSILFFTAVFSTVSIFNHHHSGFVKRTQAVNAEQITEHRYKIKFPFLAGSKAFENSIVKFQADHPLEKITYIYTAPSPLRLAESDGLIIYIQTESL